MNALAESRKAWENARALWIDTIARKFPGVDEWQWYRACAAVAGENVRRNDDESKDAALAADSEIREAHDSYIKALHAFYLLRDGPKGVLGGRGL